MLRFTLTAMLIVILVAGRLSADDPVPVQDEPTVPERVDLKSLQDRFQKKMTGATLVGHFTIDAPDSKLDDLSEERYEISSVSQMPNSNLWLFNTRIVYDEKDLTIPVPLQIKWAGDTPVITMEKITIPGLGTFSARVVIHEARYAGTWQHDDVGGHLFGRVEAGAEAPE